MCPSGVDRPDCLMPAQVRPYAALSRSDLPRIEPLRRRRAPGSELAWQGWMVGPPADSAFPNDTIASSIGLDYYRYQAFWHNPPVSFTLRDVSFTVDAYQRCSRGPHLQRDGPRPERVPRARRQADLYHGWADQAISPWTSLDYYSALAHRMGGYQAAQRFSRLYMVPGLYHCPCGPYGTGDPASTINLMAALVAWVEHGSAPAAVTFPVSGQSTGTPITSLTVQPFDPLSPPPHNNGLNSNYHYIGIDTEYRSGRELWCSQEGRQLVCTGAAWRSHEPDSHAQEPDGKEPPAKTPSVGSRTSRGAAPQASTWIVLPNPVSSGCWSAMCRNPSASSSWARVSARCRRRAGRRSRSVRGRSSWRRRRRTRGRHRAAVRRRSRR